MSRKRFSPDSSCLLHIKLLSISSHNYCSLSSNIYCHSNRSVSLPVFHSLYYSWSEYSWHYYITTTCLKSFSVSSLHTVMKHLAFFIWHKRPLWSGSYLPLRFQFSTTSSLKSVVLNYSGIPFHTTNPFHVLFFLPKNACHSLWPSSTLFFKILLMHRSLCNATFASPQSLHSVNHFLLSAT